MRAAVELLEDRIAPALLLNPRTVVFRDLDDRLAEIKLSQPLFNAATIESVLTFDAGSVDGNDTSPQQLQEINFSGLPVKTAHPLSISVFVLPAHSSKQAFVDVGFVDAPGIDLGKVDIHGDLGAIVAGTGTSNDTALSRLLVHSMGALGVASQAAGGTLTSSIAGSVKLLAAKSDLNGVDLEIAGSLRTLQIGGNLVGEAAAQSGSVEVAGSIGSAHVAGAIEGGAGPGSGEIFAESIRTAKIAGSIVGGAGNSSGALFTNAGLGRLEIDGDVRGGSGTNSGSIVADGAIRSATLGGSILGGVGTDSGQVTSLDNLHRLRVAHDLAGGAGSGSGEIVCEGNLLRSLVILGAVSGGAGSFSGFIQDGGNAGRIQIHGGMTGAAADSALIEVEGNLSALSIGSSLLGGSGASSGEVFVQGNLGSLTIHGGLFGGTAVDTGLLQIGGNAREVRVDGSVVGGGVSASGEIFSGGVAKSVHIRGDLQGGSVTGTAGATASGYLQAASFGRIVIGSSIIAGENDGTGVLAASGSIRAMNQIGSLQVGGGLLGNVGEPIIISAQGVSLVSGDRRDVALGKLQIGGGVQFAEVLAGYSPALQPVDGHAQIGVVHVRGDWTASDLVAGIQAGSAAGFGTVADSVIPDPVTGVSILSRIARVVIGGAVLGDAGALNEYGFEAETIGAFLVGGHLLPAKSFADGLTIAPTGDVTVREVSP
jgi:hypothetical protein